MTLLEIIGLARRLLSESNASLSYSTDQDLTAFINDGIKEICFKAKVYEKEATLSVSAGTATYSLPSDFIEMIYLQSPSGVLLTKIDSSQRGALYKISGKPLWYDIFGVDSNRNHRITLIDTPDTSSAGDYLYGYYALAPDLSSSDDEPAFAVYLHRYLAIYACYRHAIKSKDRELATMFYTEFALSLGIPLGGAEGGA